MQINKFLILSLFLATPAFADVILNPDQAVQIGIGGYARVYTGKLESFQYDTIFKSQPHVTIAYQATDDIRLSGKFAYRFARDDRHYDNRTSAWYDVYGTIASKRFGSLDVGKLNSVGYKLHQGVTDVSMLSTDDSDIDYFYDKPSGFFAPLLTHLNSDKRDPKISYTTSQWNGLTWGLTLAKGGDSYKTYAPNGVKVKRGKGLVTALQYKGKTPIVNVGLSAGYAYYRDDKFRISGREVEANHSEYSLGVNLEKNHYSWGASYKQMLYQNKLDIHQADIWSTGVAYDVGQYGVSLNYLESRTTFVEESKYRHLMLSGKYKLHKYVEANLSVGQVQFLPESSSDERSLFAIFGLGFKL